MTLKRIFTVVLLLFVAGSVTHLARTEISSTEETTANIPIPSKAQTQASEASSPQSDQTAGPKFVAFYFHGDFRCPTCLAIEALSKEAIEAAFPEKLELGDLEWRAVNTDEAWNAHYVTKFNLQFSSLILAETAKGEVVRWENLEEVWELVHDKEAFLGYVQSEAGTFMTVEGAI
jgi:hypothetical protein